jgi:hypothetical protein
VGFLGFMCLFSSSCSAKIKPRALHMLGKCFTTEIQPKPVFYFYFFLVELGFELRTSHL